MAFPREPDESYRSAQNEMPPRQNELPPRRFDDELQPDLEMTEGPASSGRMAAYAIAALLIVGAVLYGIAHTSTTDTASTTPPPPASNTAANTPAPAPPARPNTEPGQTTGMAPPTAPKAPAPAEGTTK